jgi:hypothetical protein
MVRFSPLRRNNKQHIRWSPQQKRIPPYENNGVIGGFRPTQIFAGKIADRENQK